MAPLHFDHIVAFFGNLDVCKTLIESGADKNIRNKNGKAPIDLASKKCHHDVVTFLLEIEN